MTKSNLVDYEKNMHESIKEQTRWIASVIIATRIGLAGLMIALLHH